MECASIAESVSKGLNEN